MAFRKPEQPDPDHPEPVEIELGALRPWQADVVLADLSGRYRMQSVSLGSVHYGGAAQTHYKVLVHADDEAAVRSELAEAERL